jgi:hypothetical protein
MHTEIKDPAIVVAKILPRMADPIEARSLMMQVINFDKVALRRLMAILGNAFNPLLGIYDRYYSLDMSNEMDRICMSKLLVQSQLHKDQCMEKCLFQQKKTKDVSQKGDWSAFRNEVIDGECSHISVELFNPIPQKGKVSFQRECQGATRSCCDQGHQMCQCVDQSLARVKRSTGLPPAGAARDATSDEEIDSL